MSKSLMNSKPKETCFCFHPQSSVISFALATLCPETEVRRVSCSRFTSERQSLGSNVGFWMTWVKAHLTTALESKHSLFPGEIWITSLQRLSQLRVRIFNIVYWLSFMYKPNKTDRRRWKNKF